ncbi:Band 4.1-like protein 5 [Fukomys damarensis]|uniref:Band 4.1-like protein 5 n=1 Tax=Fukomys damarensis TaxID=885580 RepID=A0A091DCI1_FUKDA|nr:Band 4.1-like protein 5 [Fukomys damarensis]
MSSRQRWWPQSGDNLSRAPRAHCPPVAARESCGECDCGGGCGTAYHERSWYSAITAAAPRPKVALMTMSMRLSNSYGQEEWTNSGHRHLHLPLNTDLLHKPELRETTVSDVTEASVTTAVSPALDDINTATAAPGLGDADVECGTLKDASKKLKQLEIESSPLPSPRSHIDVNINSQAEVVKLTEKCLNNAIESPGVNAMRVPPDFKSNILKAQVEAVHKVTREESLLSHGSTTVQDAPIDSAVLSENNVPVSKDSLSVIHTTRVDKDSVLKDATDELDALLLSLTENLIDNTVTPQVSSASIITPRWIIPQSSAISNGLAGCGMSLTEKEGHGNKGGISLISPPAPFLVDAVTSSAPTLTEDTSVLKHKCLLTTEL